MKNRRQKVDQNKDWIAQSLVEDEVLEKRESSNDLSLTSRTSEWFSGMEKIQDTGYRSLSDLRQTFNNFAKILGRDDIDFRFARDNTLGTACAFFEDLKNFSKPVVVIDLALVKLCAYSLDSLMGVALHEIGHILATRKLFRMKKWNILASGLGKAFANLLEDHRIEKSVLIAMAPGYSPFIEKARQTFLLENWLVSELREWPTLDELSRQTTIISAFIRFPRMFRKMPELMTWRNSCGDVFFDKVRRILKSEPRTEDDVMRMSRKLLQLYPKNPGTKHIETGANAISLEKILILGLSSMEKKPEYFELHDDLEPPQSRDSIRLKLPGRQLDNLSNELVSFERAVKNEVMCPQWVDARDSLRNQIAVLREQSLFRSRPRRVIVGGQKQGELDTKSLWKAAFQRNIFGRREQRPANRQEACTIALLLDSSFSMLSNGRLQQAFRMACLLWEGLHSAINLRIFSHFAEDRITVMEHPDPQFSMNSYRTRGGNVDCQSLLLVGSLLKDEPGHKVVMAISDGLPNEFQGKDGVAQTREAVQALRKTGVRVCGVNIGNEFDKSIYEPFQIHLPDGAALPTETAKLVMNELRKLFG